MSDTARKRDAYGYEEICPDADGRRHYRVYDANDDRIATCYVEDNARRVVRLMNAGAGLRAENDRLRDELDKRLQLRIALMEVMRTSFSADDVRLLAVGIGGAGERVQRIHEQCDAMKAAHDRAREVLDG